MTAPMTAPVWRLCLRALTAFSSTRSPPPFPTRALCIPRPPTRTPTAFPRLSHPQAHSSSSRSFTTAAPSSVPVFSSSTPTSSGPSSKRSGPPPTLNATLRRFYFLVHPDLFHSHPEHRTVNEQSLQHFLGFITAMKQTNAAEPWPPAQHTNLTFYVRRKRGDGINTAVPFVQWNETRETKGKPRVRAAASKAGAGAGAAVDGEFHVLRLTLSTNGGNCKGLVERQLRHLFHMMGLREEFTWDDEYWQLKPRMERKDGEGEGEEEDEDESYAYNRS